jgi:hypothetical protein
VKRGGVLDFSGNGRVKLSPEAFADLIASPGFQRQLAAIREVFGEVPVSDADTPPDRDSKEVAEQPIAATEDFEAIGTSDQ